MHPRKPPKLRAGGASETGPRPHNEDFFVVDDAAGVYIVTDGTGGEAGGAEAARIAATKAQSALQRADGDIEPLLKNAITEAHNEIRANQDVERHRMATTIALIKYDGRHAHIAHVGDSRVYRLRDRGLQQLTRDHSLKNYLQDNPGERPSGPQDDNILVRALGQQSEVPMAEHRRVPVAEGDLFLICSDGICRYLEDWLIAEILLGAPVTSPQEAAACLARAAVNNQAMDNATAIVLEARADHPEERGLSLGWLAFVEGSDKGRLVPLGLKTSIGADPNNDVVLSDPAVSSKHVTINAQDGSFLLEDLGSTNGTFLNEVRIDRAHLRDGDRLRFGRTPVIFKAFGAGS